MTKQDDDFYNALKYASPEDLVGAYIYHLEIHTDGGAAGEWYLRGVKAGFELAQPGGWKHIAPQWLADYRERKDKEAQDGA